MAVEALSETSLALLSAEWQKRLRLQDWDITFQIKRINELEGFGQTVASDTYRSAKIHLLDERDFDPMAAQTTLSVSSLDWEVTLVHELLHLHFHDVAQPKIGTPEYRALERGIDTIAIALVHAKRTPV